MSSSAADLTEGPLSSNNASPPALHTTTPPNTLNLESLSGKGPSDAFVSGLQPSFDGGEATGNDPSDIKAYPTNIKTEPDANHGIHNPVLF